MGSLDAECIFPTDNTTSHDCNKNMYLTCDENSKTCVCDSGYEERDGECKGSFGSDCENDGRCITGQCVNGKCGCPTDKVPSLTETSCESIYDGTCDTVSNLCHSPFFLKCGDENKCVCEDEKVYTAGKDDRRCFTKAEGSCTSGVVDECVENSSCFNGKCRCIDGLNPDADGFCVEGGGGGGSSSVNPIASVFIFAFFIVTIYNLQM
jgi:hypothetical protein